VLEDNRLQALALSIATAGGAATTASHLRLIETLEASGQLDRKTEGLADSDVLARRAAEGHGLTRPELAVVLSSTKLVLQDALEHSALPDDPLLEGELLAAFPAPMRDKFKADILEHRLRREIIATKLANRMVNRLGLIHPFELVEEEGATLAQVTTAFVAAEQLLGMAAIWQGIERQPMPEAARILLFDRAAAAMVNHMADLLRVSGGAFSAGELVGQLEGGVKLLSGATGRLLSREGQAQSAALQERFVAAGAPAELAADVAHLFDLDGSVGLAMLARQTGTKPEALTRAFIALGRELGLDWAQQAAERLAPTDPWERLLVNSLARDLQHMRLDFLRRHAGDKGEPLTVVEGWIAGQTAAIRQFRAIVTRAQAAPALSPTMLAQIGNQARNLLAR